MVFPLLGAIGGALFGSAAATAATISVAGSLVAGAVGRREERRAIAKQNDYNDPVNIRVRAEDAGFNPLSFIGAGVGNQTTTGGTNYMGAAISDATATIASNMMNSAESKARQQNLELQNQKLQKELQQTTLRPRGASIYEGVQRHGVTPGLATAAAVAHGALPKAPYKQIEPSDPAFVGPRPLTHLFNPTAKKWVGVHPLAADRLELKDGMAILAEDYEAFMGDVGAEFINLPNMANEAAGFGSLLHGAPALSLRSPVKVHPQKTPATLGSGVDSHPNIRGDNKRKPLRLEFKGP